MKKLLLASVAALVLTPPAFYQLIKDDPNAEGGAVVGGTAGGVAGGVAGGMIFGPIGAAIGGFAGAVIGSEAGIEATTVDYVRMHPTDPVVIGGTIDVGYVVPETVVIHRIEGNADFGYFYTEDRAWIVNMSDRTIVYSPGTVVAAEGDADAEVTVNVQ
jgi:hypothetical protein